MQEAACCYGVWSEGPVMWSVPVPAWVDRQLSRHRHLCRHQQQRGASRANSVSNMPFTQSGSQFTEAGDPETLGDFSQDNFSLGGGNFDFKSQVRCCSLLFKLIMGRMCSPAGYFAASGLATTRGFSGLISKSARKQQCCCAGHRAFP